MFLFQSEFDLSILLVYSIDDGDLRGYDDPQNREFLVSVMAGRIPKELINEAKGGEVHVNMEDHKEEEFKKPKVNSNGDMFNEHIALRCLTIDSELVLSNGTKQKD